MSRKEFMMKLIRALCNSHKVTLAYNFLKDLSSLSSFTRGNKAFQMKLVKYKLTT